ncbi:MAG: polymerase sigma-70 factor, subfamily [Frankiaceae bacterium]|nr:polymerase sigma-70 factor, subfamily [Frankiaceae bacterium]
MLAALVRTTGSLAIAEDAVQDAIVTALEVWPRTQVPDEPRAWLTVTARRRAIDVLRREAARGGKELAAMAAVEPDDGPVPEYVVHDDLLRLLFTCCHPALSLETQVALALRTLCGLSVAETGRALLVPEATMAKRLTRARQKIAVAGIPYRVPDAAELPDRIRGVAATVYLLFNEGYSPADGDAPERRDLAAQALRLCRLLRELLPDEASIMGLLALVLLTEARRPARIDADRFVLMADQDRSLWDASLIREGVLLVGLALQRTPDSPDLYVLQAAIAACHCLAATAGDTDWVAITSWYDVLVRIADTPVVRLNRAVALAERDGTVAGLAAMDEIDGLDSYALWHAARAELLLREGLKHEAVAAFEAALELPVNAAQREHLRARLAECRPAS